MERTNVENLLANDLNFHNGNVLCGLPSTMRRRFHEHKYQTNDAYILV